MGGQGREERERNYVGGNERSGEERGEKGENGVKGGERWILYLGISENKNLLRITEDKF